jgi:ABC-type sugar transport system substrate-binding protein
MRNSWKLSSILALGVAGILFALSPASAESGKYTIGYNYFGSGSYTLLTLAHHSQVPIDAFGDKAKAMDDQFSVEQLVQDVENMIASGVNGLVLWLPQDTLYLKVTQMCQAAKIPFVINDKMPLDDKIASEIKKNPYFVGAFGVDNSQYGREIANYVAKKGWKKCIVTSSGNGDVSDTARLTAFRKIFEANGGKILRELHADDQDTAVGQIEDALTATGEVDFIYGVGADFGIAACTVLQKHAYKTKVVTTGIDKGSLDWLRKGVLGMVNGDYFINGAYSVIALQNYLDGNPLKDAKGQKIWALNTASFNISPETIDLFTRCFVDEFCYSDNEIRQMTAKNNPKFGYDAFMKVIKDYTFENRLRQKYADGKVTAAELKAIGISVK